MIAKIFYKWQQQNNQKYIDAQLLCESFSSCLANFIIHLQIFLFHYHNYLFYLCVLDNGIPKYFITYFVKKFFCLFRLNVFRWLIPAQGEVTIKLRFVSDDLGQFDQTLNFEIVGTRRRYQLYCRGICAFPSISREPRWKLFP